jgi:hypothetical protein
MIDLDAALVAQYRERLAELRSDPDARAWGGLCFEAALSVLGDDATSEAIASLTGAARLQP